VTRPPLDALTDDLAWREAELGSLKLLLSRVDVTDHQKAVLLRASWALLYAHYEGFSKNSLTIFYGYAKNSVANCGALPLKTRLFALNDKLKRLRNLAPEPFISDIENFSVLFYNPAPEFPEVDTKSNLWPNVLEELLNDADISLTSLDDHRIRLKTLVEKRNNISHGKGDVVSEVSYYREFESAVYDIMYEMALKIDERLKSPPYS
jgi:hypothetical protein